MASFHHVTNTETSLPQSQQGEPTETIMVDETTPTIDKIVVVKTQNEKEKEDYLQL